MTAPITDVKQPTAPVLDPLDAMRLPSEAAKWLRMSESDFKKKGRAGVIPVFKLGRRQVLAHPRTIIAALANAAGVKPEIIAAMFTLPPTPHKAKAK